MRWVFRSGLFMKMLITIVLILTTVTFVLSSVLYYHFERSALASVTKNNAKFLDQLSFSVDYMNENAKYFTQSLYADADISLLMYQSNTDYVQLIGAMDRINRTIRMNSFVHSVYIYNRKLQRYLSSGNKALSSPASFSDQEIVRMLERPQENPPQRLVPLQRMVGRAGVTADEPKEVPVLTYFMYDHAAGRDGPDGILAVNIKGEYLYELIDSIQTKNASATGKTFVIDREGRVVGAAAHDSPEIRAFGTKVAAMPERTGFFLDAVDGRRVMVTYTSAGSQGWMFIHVSAYDTVIADIRKIREITIATVACLIAIEIALAVVISRSLYAPIRQLVGKITRLMGASQGDSDELVLLSGKISEAYVAMRDGMMHRKHEVLRSLLTNDLPAPERLSALALKTKSLIDPGGSYRLIAFRIDNYARFLARFSDKDRTLFRFAIGNLAAELLRHAYESETVDLGNDFVIAIVCLPSGPGPHEPRLSEICRDVQAWCSEHLRLSLTAAISAETDLDGLRPTCEQVVGLTNYRLVYGHSAVIAADDQAFRNAEQDKISAHEYALLHEALVDGKFAAAELLFSGMVERIKSQTYDMIMSNLHYLTYSVYDTLNLMEGNGVRKFDIDYSRFIKQIYRLETLEEIKELFRELFVHIAGIVQAKKDQRTSLLADAVVGLIEQNYHDKNLSLDIIADRLGMSKAYVGKIFRIAHGQSVAELILDIRMQQAMKLLEPGDKPLEDVLNRVGIENQKYFYTLFKKKFGVTFSEYKLKRGKG